jgi:dissimilatory sulfite reductase (desulfoviridin) alpha/beta subunit
MKLNNIKLALKNKIKTIQLESLEYSLMKAVDELFKVILRHAKYRKPRIGEIIQEYDWGKFVVQIKFEFNDDEEKNEKT